MKKRNYSVIHPTLQPVKKDSKTANENVNRKHTHTAKHCDAYASEKEDVEPEAGLGEGGAGGATQAPVRHR